MNTLAKIALYIIYPLLFIAAVIIAGYAWVLGLVLLIVIGIGGCAAGLCTRIDGVHEPPSPSPMRPAERATTTPRHIDVTA